MTITLGKLAADGAVSTDVAATGIVIAAVANTTVKVALAFVLGTRTLGTLVAVVLGAVAASGLVLVAL
jgi:uncharacterized membrane protein (DUF4010 family)